MGIRPLICPRAIHDGSAGGIGAVIQPRYVDILLMQAKAMAELVRNDLFCCCIAGRSIGTGDLPLAEPSLIKDPALLRGVFKEFPWPIYG